MPWRKKTKTATDWKPVRIRKEWLDMLREAGRQNPGFSPTVDLTTESEPKLLHMACQVAALYISGWFWERLTPDLDQIIVLERLRVAIKVAAFFRADVRQNADQSITIIARGKPDFVIPKDEHVGFPKPVRH